MTKKWHHIIVFSNPFYFLEVGRVFFQGNFAPIPFPSVEQRFQWLLMLLLSFTGYEWPEGRYTLCEGPLPFQKCLRGHQRQTLIPWNTWSRAHKFLLVTLSSNMYYIDFWGTSAQFKTNDFLHFFECFVENGFTYNIFAIFTRFPKNHWWHCSHSHANPKSMELRALRFHWSSFFSEMGPSYSAVAWSTCLRHIILNTLLIFVWAWAKKMTPMTSLNLQLLAITLAKRTC